MCAFKATVQGLIACLTVFQEKILPHYVLSEYHHLEHHGIYIAAGKAFFFFFFMPCEKKSPRGLLCPRTVFNS